MEVTYFNNGINDIVKNLYLENKYRPTESTIIYRIDPMGSPEFLLLNSAKAKRKGQDSWNFPQGGIAIDETVDMAAIREVKEELDIDLNSLESKMYCGFYHIKLNVGSGRELRDGFYKGKVLIFNIVKYDGNDKIILDDAEIAEYSWQKYFATVSMFVTTSRREKARAQMMALGIGMDVVAGKYKPEE